MRPGIFCVSLLTCALALAVGACKGDDDAPGDGADTAAVVATPQVSVTVLRQGTRLTLAGQLPKGVPDDITDQLAARGVELELELETEGALDSVSSALRDALLELAPALLEGQATISHNKVTVDGLVRRDDDIARLTELLEAAAKRAGTTATITLATDSLDPGQGRLVDAGGRPLAKVALTPLGGGDPVETDLRGRVPAGLYATADGAHVAIADGRPTWHRPDATAAIRVAGLDFPLDDDVPFVGLSDPEALSFEARYAADRRRRRPPPIAPRDDAWTAPWDAAGLLANRDKVNLAIIRADTAPDSARAFAAAIDAGQAEHFLIDFDGTIYQTLDVALAGHHVGELDARSVSIVLNNLMANLADDPDAAPYPADDAERAEAFAQHPRPRSGLSSINAIKVEAFGYSEAQYRSLGSLLRGLNALFPALGAGPPRDHRDNVTLMAVADAAELKGTVAHWHLTFERWDPGPAFDWEFVDKAVSDGPPRP